MKLLITTPLQVVADEDGVRRVRAYDRTGSFSLLRGHAELIAMLEVSVLCFLDAAGTEHYVAVRGGLLRVDRAGLVSVATREAVLGPDLDTLQRDVLQAMAARAAQARAAVVQTVALERGLLERLARHMQGERERSWLRGSAEPNHGGQP